MILKFYKSHLAIKIQMNGDNAELLYVHMQTNWQTDYYVWCKRLQQYH